jgi:hypothetical protein
MAGRKSDRAVADRQTQLDIRTLRRSGHIEPGAEQVALNIDGKPVQVRLAYTPCHLGGQRVWWRCPYCARRVAILYVRGQSIACRRCWRLRYKVEAMPEGDKAFRRADKLRARMGWVPGVAHGEGSRPKGMHHRTFNALVNKYRAAELQALDAMEHCIDRMNDNLGRIYTIQSARRW